MDQLTAVVMDFVKDHFLASHSIIAALAVALARVDTILRILLRFVPAEMLKMAVDRIEKRIDARIDKIAGDQRLTKPVNPAPVPGELPQP